MKIYYTAIAIAAIVVIYFIAALSPLPWYIYLPFVLVFVLAFYWDKLVQIFPVLAVWNSKRAQRNVARGARKKALRSTHGKRM